jgi:hypothetical protein
VREKLLKYKFYVSFFHGILELTIAVTGQGGRFTRGKWEGVGATH